METWSLVLNITNLCSRQGWNFPCVITWMKSEDGESTTIKKTKKPEEDRNIIRTMTSLRGSYLNIVIDDKMSVKVALTREKWSATSNTARNELYTAPSVDSSIVETYNYRNTDTWKLNYDVRIQTEVKARTMLSTDWKAWRVFSSACWVKVPGVPSPPRYDDPYMPPLP